MALVPRLLFSAFLFTASHAQSCTTDSECPSKACAKEEVLDDAPLTCCTAGKQLGTTFSDLMNSVYYCNNLGGGMRCNGNDAICASGVCKHMICLEVEEEEEVLTTTTSATEDNSSTSTATTSKETTPTTESSEDGKPCYSGSNCSSGICDVENGCSSTKLPDGSRCSGSKDSDNCLSNECARKPGGSKYICCYNGESKQGDSFADIMSNTRYCVGEAMDEAMEQEEEGKACDAGWQCSSGICDVENGCSSSKLPDGSRCSGIVDDDNCVLGECARAESGSSKKVCCEGGESMYVSFGNTVCKNLPIGSKCAGRNELCAAGRCGFDGLCANDDGSDVSQGDSDENSGTDYTFDPPKALDGTVLCDDGTTHGYATLSSLNFESNKYGVDNASEQTFVLCPGTYDLSKGTSQQRTRQIALQNGQTVQCGDDGVSTDENGNARCIIYSDWGRNEQVWFADDSDNVKVIGLTFEATSSESVVAKDSNSQNRISFEDCHWNFGGSSRSSAVARSHISVSMSVSFNRCTFRGNSPNEHIIDISSHGAVSIIDTIFLSNEPSESIINVDNGGKLDIFFSCFVDNSVGIAIVSGTSSENISIEGNHNNYFSQNQGVICAEELLIGTDQCQSISSTETCTAKNPLSLPVGDDKPGTKDETLAATSTSTAQDFAAYSSRNPESYYDVEGNTVDNAEDNQFGEDTNPINLLASGAVALSLLSTSFVITLGCAIYNIGL